jgi:hypothetical protein
MTLKMVREWPPELICKQQAASSKQATNNSVTADPRSIRVLIGYDWKSDASAKKSGGLNRHWAFLRDEVKAATETLERISKNQGTAPNPLRVTVGRLRARHGVAIISEIVNRIKEADVLIFDISGGNSNVHFELGCAIAFKGLGSGCVYVFSSSSPVASDLSGLMLTKYVVLKDDTGNQNNFAKLVDARGFRAALISTLKQIAITRGMFGRAKDTFDSDEDDEKNIS